MPFEALRFIHASNVVVDHQLHHVGVISDGLRETVQTATVTAFETLVTECVEKQIDFLLLAGNSFVQSDHSLQGRLALMDGVATLAEHGIQVFVVPGEADPAVEWKSTNQLLANATLFLPRIDEPIAILRDSRLIASIRTADQIQSGRKNHDNDSPFDSARTEPFCIGLVDAVATFDERSTESSSDDKSSIAGNEDYLIYVGDGPRVDPKRSRKIIRRPRGTQGIRPADTGPRGCTLVEVHGDGSVRETFISTACVRWEQPRVTVHENTTWDTLTETMADTVSDWDIESSEEVLLIRWQIDGSGPLFQSLGNEQATAELIKLLDAELKLPDGLSCVHQIERSHSEARLCESTGGESFASQFGQFLRLDHGISRESMEHAIENSRLSNESKQRIHSFIRGIDHDAVTSLLAKKGTDWFVNDSRMNRASIAHSNPTSNTNASDSEPHAID